MFTYSILLFRGVNAEEDLCQPEKSFAKLVFPDRIWHMVVEFFWEEFKIFL